MLELKSFTQDTSAIAFIVGDYGEMAFDSDATASMYRLKKHIRIKVLKNGGLKYGNVILKTYDINGFRESISSFEGRVYNLENGEIVTSKFKSKEIIEEKNSDDVLLEKIFLPNVKVGSVIEYSYVLNSYFLGNPHDWNIQHDIPCLVSDFTFKMPQSLRFNVITPRYLTVYEFPSEVMNQQRSYSTIVRTSKIGRPNQKIYHEKTELSLLIRRWRAENVPSYVLEPFISSEEELKAKLKINISSSSNGMFDYANSWSSILEEKYKLAYKGVGENKLKFLKDKLELIRNQSEDKLVKAKLVFELVRSRIKWNGEYSSLRSAAPKEIYNKRSGNVIDVNLFLVDALNQVGVSAVLMYGNIRGRGKLIQSIPDVSQLIYGTAVASIDGEKVVLDATSEFTSFELIPQRALNYQGVLMSSNKHVNGQFMEVIPQGKDDLNIRMKVEINNDLSIKGEKSITYKGYARVNFREYCDEISEEEYITSLEEKVIGLSISDYSKKDIEDLHIEEYVMERENAIEKVGSKIFFNPLNLIDVAENPFIQEQRMYPVEFPYGIDRRYIFQIELPQNYDVVNIPSSIQVMLPNNGGRFKFQVSKYENKLIYMVDFELNQLVFLPEEYSNLKLFYEKAFSLQTIPIELVQKKEN
ncbi:DUF3857 domain-containing protein [Flammeovirga pectinis]|nr:DUF3857 domain-containing protein [Flammeovirga pectinis]